MNYPRAHRSSTMSKGGKETQIKPVIDRALTNNTPLSAEDEGEN